VLQLIFKSAGDEDGASGGGSAHTLMDLRIGQEGVLERLDLPHDTSRRLMELGFLPGSTIVVARSAPGGDPKVFRVDGSEIALRNETSARIFLRNGNGAAPGS
jgi:Fe2+ transport system protein FeoA